MAKGEVNRNLLFGLLALQNGFVDQSALVAAFQSWVRDKSHSIADYLIKRGDLEMSCKSALEALVELHREDDGQSLERGVVATLNRNGQLLAELTHCCDLEVQSIAKALAAVAVPADRHDLEATADDATRSYRTAIDVTSGRRFRVIRFHAEGGLGAVYLAHDEELNRDVALKRIKGGPPHDPGSHVRFLREAEITGRLEHPGVVPVYGLGLLADGRPEYAMRFIEGESLKTAITRHHSARARSARDRSSHDLALPNLVRRFLDVCNTISYAHNRGIVHRDIKPSNVMLGPFGETIVVDWGLAKSIGRPTEAVDLPEPTVRPTFQDDGRARTIGPVGTPHYMSPEQTATHLDHVSFASDIYGLGATLYCLLTGKAPFQGSGVDTPAMLALVRSGEFRKPREINPAVPRPLEAVCLKAMALRPEDRYPSAQALGLDIERWLADAPVSVYREPLTDRLGRWVRRHKTLVTAAAMLVVCALVALGIDVVRVGRERAVAEENFVMARDAVNRILSETAEGRLAAVPQAEELRLQISKDALQFNERFLRQQPRNPSVLRDAASTYRQVANIQRMLNHADARETYGQAIALWEKLLVEFPGDIGDQLNLALTLADIGELARTTGDLHAAEETCRRAVTIADQLLKLMPNEANCHLARAMGLLYLAQVQTDAQQYEEARRSAEGAATEFRPLIRHPLDGARNALLLFMALDNWGKALRHVGESKEAEKRLSESTRLSTSLLDYLAKNPLPGRQGDAALLPNIRFARGQAELELGLLLAPVQSRKIEAADHFDRAVNDLSGLAQAFPRITIYETLRKAATRGRDEIRGAKSAKP
jgi:serine/threonine-protein kinase